jgi:hypothetical protein
MLSKKALAGSLAILAGASYLFLVALNLIWPSLFNFIFNAQFLGANVASLFPQIFSLGRFVGTFFVLVATGWVGGYIWGLLYNRFVR